jgi:hypothetical protein
VGQFEFDGRLNFYSSGPGDHESTAAEKDRLKKRAKATHLLLAAVTFRYWKET